MATPPKQLPLTEAEQVEGRTLGEAWHTARIALDTAAAARDAWFVRMDTKYRGQFYDLPARLSKLAGASRWTYGRAVRDAGTERGERSA
jgi:hypothetical protein